MNTDILPTDTVIRFKTNERLSFTFEQLPLQLKSN